VYWLMIGCFAVAFLASLAEYLFLRFLMGIRNIFTIWESI